MAAGLGAAATGAAWGVDDAGADGAGDDEGELQPAAAIAAAHKTSLTSMALILSNPSSGGTPAGQLEAEAAQQHEQRGAGHGKWQPAGAAEVHGRSHRRDSERQDGTDERCRRFCRCHLSILALTPD